MSVMVPCSDCSRHVRPDETHCPFCGEAVAFVPIRAPRAWRNLGRAALLGFAAASLGACGGGDDAGTDDTVDDGSTGGEDTGGDDTGGDDTGDIDDGGGAVPAYGVPADPEPDPEDDGSADSGGPDDMGAPVAMYGVPAPDDE